MDNIPSQKQVVRNAVAIGSSRVKLLVCIINYYAERVHLVRRAISELMIMRELGHGIDFVVYVGHDDMTVGGEGINVIRSHVTGWDFEWCSRADMIASIGEYDLFINMDDDVFIRRESVLAFLDEANKLPTGYIPGFLVVEQSGGYIHMINMHTSFSPAIEEYHEIGGRLYFTPLNVHSAMFMATPNHLRTAIDSGQYDPEKARPREQRNYGVPEWAHSNIYVGCGLTKVIPVDNVETFLVYHHGSKFSSNPPASGRYYTLDEMKSILGNRRVQI